MLLLYWQIFDCRLCQKYLNCWLNSTSRTCVIWNDFCAGNLTNKSIELQQLYGEFDSCSIDQSPKFIDNLKVLFTIFLLLILNNKSATMVNALTYRKKIVVIRASGVLSMACLSERSAASCCTATLRSPAIRLPASVSWYLFIEFCLLTFIYHVVLIDRRLLL